MKLKAALVAILAALCLPATAAAALAVPTNVHVSNATTSSLTLAWNGTTPKYAVWLDGKVVTRVTTKSYKYTGLTCGTTHTLGVRSVSGSNVSAIVSVQGTTSQCPVTGGSPPPTAGYFPTLQPVGSFASLPSDSQCATQVHYSTWEPRPLNTKRNHVLVDPAAAHSSLAARQYDTGSYDSRWNTALRPRVDGQFTGTTDEIFQWAACKWGLPDNLLRGMAVRESTWYQYLVYPGNRPVNLWGSGDYFPSATADSKIFCDGIDQLGNYNYQAIYGNGLCPKTYSITGIMSWDAPAWQAPNPAFPGNQNGTFPFNRNSTAFAEDYVGSYLRGCYEGWIKWLGPSGDIQGCVGSWYSGGWHDVDGDAYASRVQTEIDNHTWLGSSWPTTIHSCDPTYGCPTSDTLPDN
jgi:hypothetical protein